MRVLKGLREGEMGGEGEGWDEGVCGVGGRGVWEEGGGRVKSVVIIAFRTNTRYHQRGQR